jgi:hypothetical protein
MALREINTGRGISRTSLTPFEIALVRSRRIDSLSGQGLFQDTFSRVRKVALDVPDLEVLWQLCRWDTVMEAAYIEALASLRAEGHRL